MLLFSVILKHKCIKTRNKINIKLRSSVVPEGSKVQSEEYMRAVKSVKRVHEGNKVQSEEYMRAVKYSQKST